MILKRLDAAVIFVILFSTAIGAYLRISQLVDLPLPLNDGGLFYAMTKDLQENQFRIPAVTSFNGANIPYAYPPLAFYLYGFISMATNGSLMDLFRLLPAIIASLSIPAFYWLAKELLKDQAKSAMATFIYACLPASYLMLIMGGGATRSLGFLFYLLTLFFAYRMFTLEQKKYIVITALFGALTCLSHPESAARAAASAILLFLFFGRNRRGAVKALLVAGGVILLTAPWWAAVISRHGIAPFLAATQTGGQKPLVMLAYLLSMLKGMLTESIFLTFLGSMAMLGFFLQLAKKEYFLPVWLLVTLLVEPRNSSVYLALIVAMLASIGAVDLIFKVFRELETGLNKTAPINHWTEGLLSGWMNKIVLTYLVIFSIISSYLSVSELSRTLIVTRSDLEAVEWVNKNVLPGQSFIFIKAYSIPEWFPILTHGRSVALVQGQEWQSKDFSALLDISNHLELCAEQGKACLDDWQKESGLSYQYVYFGKWRVNTRDGAAYTSWPLKASLVDSGEYEVVYESESREILKRKE